MTHWSCIYLTLWSRDNQQMTLWSCSHLALFSHVSQLILLTWQSPEFLLKWQLWSWFFGSVMQLVHFDHVTVRKLFSQQSAEPLVTWSELDNINIKQFHEIGIESVLQNWHTKKIDRLPILSTILTRLSPDICISKSLPLIPFFLGACGRSHSLCSSWRLMYSPWFARSYSLSGESDRLHWCLAGPGQLSTIFYR